VLAMSLSGARPRQSGTRAAARVTPR